MDVACDIFHAFPSGGRCYTFPPTDATHLFHLPGLCEIFTFIECSLEELLMGTVFDIKSDEADEILGSLLVEPLDLAVNGDDTRSTFRAVDTPVGAALMTAAGRTLHVAGHLRADNWRGRERVQLHIDDVAHAGA
ncbi:MAG: hypothetical protein IIA73_11730 [Proteobacteria bacterium]|nr:hypothetical protein [Pseudomonadota bacterium]